MGVEKESGEWRNRVGVEKESGEWRNRVGVEKEWGGDGEREWGRVGEREDKVEDSTWTFITQELRWMSDNCW